MTSIACQHTTPGPVRARASLIAVKRLASFGSCLLALAGAAGWFYLPLRFALIAAAGRGNGCPPAHAWAIPAEKKVLTRVKDDILAKSRLLQKEYKGLELYETPYGLFWTPNGSRYILPFNLAEEATHIYGAGRHFVRPGEVVLDCGANVGVFTRFALNAGARLVVAIEPAPDNLECLRRNFRNEIEQRRVILVPKGVWDREDTLELRVDPENQAADTFVIPLQSATGSVRVPLTTIDHLVSELALDRVDFVKMDIEGAEVRALQGARETLQRFHPRMSLSVYHQDDHPVEVPRAARAAWPAYRVECGPCNAPSETRVRPDVLFFE